MRGCSAGMLLQLCFLEEESGVLARQCTPLGYANRRFVVDYLLLDWQDVAARGGKAYPLHANVAAASDVPAIVIPADAVKGFQVCLAA